MTEKADKLWDEIKLIVSNHSDTEDQTEIFMDTLSSILDSDENRLLVRILKEYIEEVFS